VQITIYIINLKKNEFKILNKFENLLSLLTISIVCLKKV